MGTSALTLTDSANGGSYAIAGSAAGSVTGSLTANGSATALANFSIDANGNGTLTYANGTTAQIVDYIVE